MGVQSWWYYVWGHANKKNCWISLGSAFVCRIKRGRNSTFLRNVELIYNIIRHDLPEDTTSRPWEPQTSQENAQSGTWGSRSGWQEVDRGYTMCATDFRPIARKKSQNQKGTFANKSMALFIPWAYNSVLNMEVTFPPKRRLTFNALEILILKETELIMQFLY